MKKQLLALLVLLAIVIGCKKDKVVVPPEKTYDEISLTGTHWRLKKYPFPTPIEMIPQIYIGNSTDAMFFESHFLTDKKDLFAPNLKYIVEEGKSEKPKVTFTGKNSQNGAITMVMTYNRVENILLYESFEFTRVTF